MADIKASREWLRERRRDADALDRMVREAERGERQELRESIQHIVAAVEEYDATFWVTERLIQLMLTKKALAAQLADVVLRRLNAAAAVWAVEISVTDESDNPIEDACAEVGPIQRKVSDYFKKRVAAETKYLKLSPDTKWSGVFQELAINGHATIAVPEGEDPHSYRLKFRNRLMNNWVRFPDVCREKWSAVVSGRTITIRKANQRVA